MTTTESLQKQLIKTIPNTKIFFLKKVPFDSFWQAHPFIRFAVVFFVLLRDELRQMDERMQQEGSVAEDGRP